MQYSFGNCKLTFDLPNGIFVPGFDSATGKTYACKLLNGGIEGLEINDAQFVTYNKYADMYKLVKDVLTNKNNKLVFLDRFDKYSTSDILKCIEENRDGKIIIVDIKDRNIDIEFDYGYCEIELKSPFEVKLYDPYYI